MVLILLGLLSALFYSNLSWFSTFAILAGVYFVVTTILELFKLPNLNKRAVVISGQVSKRGEKAQFMM